MCRPLRGRHIIWKDTFNDDHLLITQHGLISPQNEPEDEDNGQNPHANGCLMTLALEGFD